MRLLACLVLAACTSKQPMQQAPAKELAASKVTDPWAGSGSAEPAWAKDPPEVLRAKINAVNAHIVVLKSSTFREWRDVLAVVEKLPGVANAEAITFSELEIEKAGRPPQLLSLKGVDPARVSRVLTVGQHMKSGSFDALAKVGEPPPIILGDTLVSVLGAAVGDDVTVRALKDADYMTRDAKETVFRVAGTFHMDLDVYDDELGFASFAAAQAMLRQGDVASGIEMTVADIKTSAQLAKAIEAKLGGPPYQATDWYELNKKLFDALGHKRP
jgi:ABC-type lipoprotein release transport system permease subunit